MPTSVCVKTFFRLFSSFQSLQFLQQIYVNNVHPVYSAGIQTHDLQNVSLLPLPLDQYSRPNNFYTFKKYSWQKYLSEPIFAYYNISLHLAHNSRSVNNIFPLIFVRLFHWWYNCTNIPPLIIMAYRLSTSSFNCKSFSFNPNLIIFLQNTLAYRQKSVRVWNVTELQLGR